MPNSFTEHVFPAYPRYTTISFPPYRFRPGIHPHPTANPHGHSYEPDHTSLPPVAFHPPEHWQHSQDYLFGCDLYNHGYWWEAHEAWEGLWHVVPHQSVQHRFLQGIIQVSARHLKLVMSKRDGVESLALSCDKHMQFVLPQIGQQRFMGVPLQTWYQEVVDYFHLAMSRNPIMHDYTRYPYLVLE